MALMTVESWDLEHPNQLLYEEHDGFVAEPAKDYGANLIVPIGGVAWKIWGGTRSFFLYHSCPGTTPIYFFQIGRVVYFSQSLIAIRAKAAELGQRVKDITQAKEGIAYHWSVKGMRRYVVDTIKVNYESMTLTKAGEKFLDLMVQAAGFWKGEKVLTTVSGGTDGILTALALKLAGVDQHCVCVGRSEEDFDPMHARKYCEQLDLPYTFIQLPDENDDEALEALLTRALKSIELTDFSNVLMGMCNTLVGDFAAAINCNWVLTADIADVVLGQDLLSWGSFNKEHPNASGPKWAEYRNKNLLRTLPNNLMVYKVFNFVGLRTGQVFLDRRVLEFLLSLPLDCTPTNGKKPVYYQALKGYITDGSWEASGKKVGFYTGSGIGKTRLDNPILSDTNIRRIYNSLTKD
jgi:hypothetical protein